jgi:tetratricopeptide (TPR) repeat protein
VAQAVAEAIGGSLAPAERSSLAVRPTRDPRAWEHLLRGNFLVARRTQEDAQRAVAEYQEAIRLDSSYVDAYGALGSTYALAHNWSWRFPGVPQESLLARAGRAAQRGLALDSGSAAAWSAAAATKGERNGLTLEGVAPAYRRAIALDPRRADPYHFLGIALLLQGDDSGGTAALHQALALEPERPITLTWLGNAALHQRRYDAARQWLDSALSLSPDFSYALGRRAVVRTLQGDTVGGLRDANGALRATRGDSLLALGALAWVEAVARDTAQARRHARIVTTASGSVLDEATAWAAAAFVALGDRDAALAALESMPRIAFDRFYMGYEVFDPIRDEPRFRRIVALLQD